MYVDMASVQPGLCGEYEEHGTRVHGAGVVEGEHPVRAAFFFSLHWSVDTMLTLLQWREQMDRHPARFDRLLLIGYHAPIFCAPFHPRTIVRSWPNASPGAERILPT